jgi:hypothetical protein
MSLFDDISAKALTAATNSVLAAQTPVIDVAATVSQFKFVFDEIKIAINQGLGSVTLTLDPSDWVDLSPVLTAKGYTFTTRTTTQIITSANGTTNTNHLVYYYTIKWANISNGVATQVTSSVSVADTSTPISGLNITSFTGTVGALLVVKFKPIGGVAPYWFTVTGNVPDGTTFSSSSSVNFITLTGTPTVPANEYATLNITVVDNIGQTFSHDIDWTTVRNPPTVAVG